MSSRSKWNDMVASGAAEVCTKSKPCKHEKKESKAERPTDALPADKGSTVDTIRSYNENQKKMLSDL